MRVTALRDRYTPSMAADPRVEAIDLSEALAREWPTDAHVAAYEPYVVPIEGSDRVVPVRLSQDVYAVLDAHDVPPVRIVAAIGDVDAPGHTPMPEWRADMTPRLDASGLAWFETRGGYRVIGTLPTPFEIAGPADADTWTRWYLGWAEWLERTHEIALDRRCADWTRLQRLPNVAREGVGPVRATVHGALAPIDPVAHWIEPPASATATQRAATPTTDATIARAHALASRLPPSVEGHGGDEALFRAACELATVLGEDAAAIAAVLGETFNARCVPPWDAAKIQREAARAAERQATPEARFARRRQAARDVDADAYVPPPSGLARHGRIVDRSLPPPPLVYVIEGLDLAQGKVSAIQAFANVAKTPFALLMTICVAAGVPFLGHETRQRNALFLAFEGGILTEEREARLCAGLGLDRASVPLTFMHVESFIDEAFLDDLEAHVTEHAIGLITIDTYGSALAGDIDHNSDKFSHWLKQLGRLSDATGALIVVLLHENKSEGATGLRKMSGHNSAPGAIQASIALRREDENDRTLITVQCAREVRTAFAPFAVRWTDTPCDGAPTGKALCAELAARPAKPVKETSAQQKARERKQLDLKCGKLIWERMKVSPGGYFSKKELEDTSANRNANRRAIDALRDARLIEMNGREWRIVPGAERSTALRVSAALGGDPDADESDHVDVFKRPGG